MFGKLHIKITIFAALVTTIYCILFLDSFTKSCISIISSIVIFYFISGFISMNINNYQQKLKAETIEKNQAEQELAKINEKTDEENQGEELGHEKIENFDEGIFNEEEFNEEEFEDMGISN